MRRQNLMFFAPLLLAVATLGCGSSDASATGTPAASPDTKMAATTPAAAPSEGTVAPSATPSAKPAADLDDPASRKPKAGDDVAVIETDLGKIVVMFFPDKAPNHVQNFLTLANKKFYDGTKFHRTIPGFMIQGGDPNTKKPDQSTWGQGGPGYNVKNEFNDVHHARGILSMARSQDPDSAGSQFFIMVKDNGQLDGQYTVFGKVVTGMEIVDKIVALPSEEGSGVAKSPVTVKSVHVEKWPLKG